MSKKKRNVPGEAAGRRPPGAGTGAGIGDPGLSATGRQTEPSSAGRGTRRARPLWIAAAVVVVLVLGGAGVIALAGSGAGAAIGLGGSHATLYAGAQPGEERALGPASAKVTITEYGDFNCVPCREWHDQDVLQRVIADYGDQVRFVWRDLPIITPQSPHLAEAGHCAQAQNKFWPYLDKLFEYQGLTADAQLVLYAQQVGMDADGFKTCLDSGATRGLVERDWEMARALTFRAAPSFTVGKSLGTSENIIKLAGPPQYEPLKGLIEQKLRGE